MVNYGIIISLKTQGEIDTGLLLTYNQPEVFL